MDQERGMHDQPPNFEHPLLVLVLALANIPLYIAFETKGDGGN